MSFNSLSIYFTKVSKFSFRILTPKAEACPDAYSTRPLSARNFLKFSTVE